MKKINTILNIDELSKLKQENPDINGELEDSLDYIEIIKDEPFIYSDDFDYIKIDDLLFLVQSILVDNFEEVVIVKDADGELYKYGLIISDVGEYFAYELYEEKQEYYQSIIDAKIGTKINVYSGFVGLEHAPKTFIKVEKSKLLEVNREYKLTRKTNQGILSPVIEGVYTILKSETLLSNDSVSEDRVTNEVSKMKHDIAKKLNIDVSRFEEEIEEEIEKENEFEEGFVFSKEYCFSIETPTETYYNPLTQTVLVFNGDKYEKLNDGWLVNDEFVEEVYQFLFQKFGVSEEMEGYWVIENTKLETILRSLVRTGARLKANDNNASMFLQRFLRLEKLERILKTSKNIQIVKEIISKEDVIQFSKDSGTEMYYQLGQIMTSVLEGTQRLYGENHIVFDSDYKIIICQVKNVDLISASEYAIDNGYKNFYVINKDNYQQYDAWYKETIVLNDKKEDKILPIDFSDTEKLLDDIDKVVNKPVEEQLLYESDEPIDIVIVGTEYDESHDFEINDDYAGFQLTKNGENQIDCSVDCDGFVSVVDAMTFFTGGEDKVEGLSFGLELDNLVGGVEFYMIHDFVGELKLRVSVDDTYVDTTELIDNYIWHQIDTDKDIEIELDFNEGEVIEINKSNYNDIKKYYHKIKQK